MRHVVAGLAASLALAVFACSSPQGAVPAGPPGTAPAGAAKGTAAAPKASPWSADGLPAHPVRGDFPGLRNLSEVAPGLYRSSSPEGDEAFAMLAKLGVTTILSVDGARPDVESAAEWGMRYVHVPIGYSGIPREQEMRIAKVALQAKEKGEGLLVHCHYGKHRGPAACAVALMARDGIPGEEAVEDLRRAGTDPRYAGLYEAVRGFRPPTAEELARVRPEDLPPVAPTPDLVQSMVETDGTWTRMVAVRGAGWATPASHPDVQPAHEARILAERFREIARLKDVAGRPEEFRKFLSDAEKASWDLEAALRAGDAASSAAAHDRVAASCAACHKVYRDREGTSLSK